MARKRLVKFYKGEKRNYEVPVILSQKLSEVDLKKQLEEMKKIAINFEAEIIDVSNTQIKSYAYAINTPNNKKGYYACFYMKANPKNVAQIKEKFLVEPNVLRVLVLLANPKKQTYGIFSPKYDEDYKNRSQIFSYDDPNSLIKFIGERGKIEAQKITIGKIITKNASKKQRTISKIIKTARVLSILPYQED